MYQFSIHKTNHAPYIPLHIDNRGVITISVVAANNVSLVHIADGLYKSITLNTGDIVNFDSDKHHGLLPTNIADEICASQSLVNYFNWVSAYRYKLCPIVMAWDFISPT